MISGIKYRFLLLIAAVVALSALMSLAGPVMDAAIGRGYVGGVVAQLLGGPGNNWVPARMHSQEVLLDRQQRLRELATDGRYIHTANHIFDPLRDPALPMLGVMKVERAYPSKRGGSYYIVQFEGNFWDRKFEARIRSTGAEMVGSLPVNAAVVRATPVQVDQLERTAQVRWTGVYHALYRIDPVLLALTEGEREEQFLDGRGRVTLVADLFPGERASDYAADVASLKGVTEVQALDEVPGQLSGNIQMKVGARDLPGTLQALSRVGGVRHVGASGNVELLNDTSRWVHQTYDGSADLDVAAKVHARGVTGFRQIVAVVDTGLENDNCQFRYGVDLSEATYYQMRDADTANPLDNVDRPCNKVIAYYLSDDAVKYDPKQPAVPQHGTHVASTIAGDNFRTDSGGNGLAAYCEEDPVSGDPVLHQTGSPPSVHAGGDAGRYDGVAPAVQLVIQDRGMEPGAGLDLAAVRVNEVAQAWQSGARYQNNSFGIANLPTYDTLHSLQLDNFLFHKRTMNVTFAAGDTGQEPPPTLAGWGAVAKNTITVGEAQDGVTGEGMDLAQSPNSGSSRGPTTDGRLKPDLCSRGPSWAATAISPFPADQDIGTAGDGDCGVEYGGGTSFATPVVTGLAALVGQYFEDGYYPTGRRTRARWAVPGLRMTLDSGTPLQTDPAVNPDAGRCQADPSLCDPGTSFRPTNALIKAVLVNATRNMTGENTASQPSTSDSRPNYGQGWGLPVIDDALYFEGDSAVPDGQRSGLLVLTDTPNGVLGDWEATDIRDDVLYRFEGAFSSAFPPEIKEWDVTALPGEPLIVTLAWSDAGEGSVAGGVLRSDLDLEVIGPNPFGPPGDDICWRPNPDVAYTGPAPGFRRDGWVETETLLQSGEAHMWLGKDGVPVPSDKSLWPDFASADRFNNLEQIAIRASEVVGGTYKVRVVNWDVRGSATMHFVDGEPDFEVDGKGVTGAGTDDVELDQQGFALLLTGGFATNQGVVRFDRPSYGCGPFETARIQVRDENGCADPDPSVLVTTTTPGAFFPSDREIFTLVPEFPCDPGLPAGDPAQPKRWWTDPFPVVDTGDPAEVLLGDGRASLAPGYQVLARYEDVDPAGGVSTARASLLCQTSFADDGYILEGGCDLMSPTQPEAPDNPRIPDQFMDADELVEYTAYFVNTGTRDVTGLYATLGQVDDRDGDPLELHVLNNPVYVGTVPSGKRGSATFLVQVGERAPAGHVQPRERVTVQLVLTSPGDHLFVPQTFRTDHTLEADLQTYTYNTRDTRGDLFGMGGIEELKPGRRPEEGPSAYVDYDNMLIDPGPNGVYDGSFPPAGDDSYSLNFLRWLPLEATDPWDFNDDPDGWITYVDPVFDAGAPSDWVWAADADGSTAGGCGWADNYTDRVGVWGNGIWHTGRTGYAQGIGGVRPASNPINLGPDPDRMFDDIFTAPNNQPPVCATYRKAPDDPASPFYLWYLKPPRIYKVTRSPEFEVAWQRWTLYTRIFGHATDITEDYTAFAGLLHNRPINSPQPDFRPFQYFNGVYAVSTNGPFAENPVCGDWTDDTQNTFTFELAHPDPARPDRSYEEIYGPASVEGWEHALMWWLTSFGGRSVPNRYGMGISDSSFIWTESRPVEDTTDCVLTFQRSLAFFNQERYDVCEGEMHVTVVDPNQPGLGFVYASVVSEEEPPPGELVRLRQNPGIPTRYDGRIPFTVDPGRDIPGVLLVAAGQLDGAPGADAVTLQYDPREPQDGSDLGMPDWLDDGWSPGGCQDVQDGENDDYRNNCTGDLMDASTMAPTPDDDGDTCPDGDGVPDAEDDCDALLDLDDPLCRPIQDSCLRGGYEANDHAWVNCPGGGLFYVRHELFDVGAGDGDRYADRNEEVYLSVDLLNLRSNDIIGATVRISTPDDTICILDEESYYGDIPGVTTARLNGWSRREQIASTPPTHPVTGAVNYFRIGVPSETITSDLDAVQKALVRVDVYSDVYSTAGTAAGSFAPLTFEMLLDLDPVANGLDTDFFETFCDANGMNCANPPGKLNQPWYTEQGFWADPDAGIAYVDSTERWPGNGGFCPECDFTDHAECSTTHFQPPATQPPCDYIYDGTGPSGTPDYIDDWHIETLGDGVELNLGTTHSGANALHFGDHSTLSYHDGQLSALE